jgi:ATP-dependent Zn protease
MKTTPWGVIGPLVILGIAIALVLTFVNAGQQQPAQWSYSELVRHAQAGEVQDVTISGGSATATDKKGTKHDVSLPDQTATLASDLTAAGVNVHYDSGGGLGSMLVAFLPNLLFFGLIGLLIWWTFRGLGRGPQNAATSFGRANARLAAPEQSTVTFADVAGVDEAKQELTEVVDFLVMAALPRCDRVHRISIISRGSALGWTLSLPGDDQHLVDEEALRDQLAGIMGGRAAEALTFGRVTSGAENDIQRATRLARRMVTQWGMSERVGAVAMGENEELVFLGRDLGERRNYSERMASLIDDEVRRLVKEALGTAGRVLAERREALGRLAERLIVEETIDGDRLARLLAAGAPPARPVAVAR